MAARPFLASVIQSAPVRGGLPMSTATTLERVDALVGVCARDGAQLAVLPEAFVGGYPKGEDFGVRLGSRTAEGREAFARYFERSIVVPGPVTETLGEVAARHGVELVVGVVEQGGSTLYCSALFFSATGELRGKHRKLVPTGLERCVWGRGDGSTLSVFGTELGRIGAAICWENYMPLYRTSLYERGIELYCAPTVDDREVWQATMRHVAVEARSYVLSACQFVPGTEGPGSAPLIRGGSVIVDPFGEVLAGPVYGEDAVLLAEIDPGAIARARFDLDVVGHYARPDVFELRVDERAR